MGIKAGYIGKDGRFYLEEESRYFSITPDGFRFRRKAGGEVIVEPYEWEDDEAVREWEDDEAVREIDSKEYYRNILEKVLFIEGYGLDDLAEMVAENIQYDIENAEEEERLHYGKYPDEIIDRNIQTTLEGLADSFNASPYVYVRVVSGSGVYGFKKDERFLNRNQFTEIFSPEKREWLREVVAEATMINEYRYIHHLSDEEKLEEKERRYSVVKGEDIIGFMTGKDTEITIEMGEIEIPVKGDYLSVYQGGREIVAVSSGDVDAVVVKNGITGEMVYTYDAEEFMIRVQGKITVKGDGEKLQGILEQLKNIKSEILFTGTAGSDEMKKAESIAGIDLSGIIQDKKAGIKLR